MSHRKYATDEEAKAAHKAQLKAWREAHRDYYAKNKEVERKVKNAKTSGVWGSEVYTRSGIRIKIGSVSKANPTTAFIEGCVTYKHTTDISTIRRLKNSVEALLKSKIDSQEEYDKKNRILIIEAYDSSIDEYNNKRNRSGSWKHLLFELHIKKIGRSFNWVETVTFLEPIVKDIQSNIETLAEEYGLELKSTKDSSSVAAKPEAS